jgi:hypothetical protein
MMCDLDLNRRTEVMGYHGCSPEQQMKEEIETDDPKRGARESCTENVTKPSYRYSQRSHH